MQTDICGLLIPVRLAIQINNIFKGIDISLMTIFRELHAVFLTHRVVEESKEYKSIINILRNSQKKLKNNFERKASIFALPMAHKWHIS